MRQRLRRDVANAGFPEPARHEVIEVGVEPLNELMAALRTKALVGELEGRRRDGG